MNLSDTVVLALVIVLCISICINVWLIRSNINQGKTIQKLASERAKSKYNARSAFEERLSDLQKMRFGAKIFTAKKEE